MNNIPQDLTGKTFGRWTVIARAPSRGATKKARWYCRCSCGTERDVAGVSLRRGFSKSCGCLHKFPLTHGATGSAEYDAWAGINQRCYTPTNNHYNEYGARGITVCERWRQSFENFYTDMGPKPTKEHSLDRINNNGPYSPDNCRWATTRQQNRNTRRNVMLTHNGETLCVAEWAERIGINRYRLYSRLKSGWSVERTLSEPLRPRRR